MKLKYIILPIFTIANSLSTDAQSKWKMQTADLQTRWSAQVGPSQTHMAYPRPQLQRKSWDNLNGLWDYAITPKDSAPPNTFNEKILVPYPLESALSGVKKKILPDQNLWYRKKIQKPVLKAGERVLLHFGAVDWQCAVFVNGAKIGGHTGGFTGFHFDVTDHLKPGSNELLVKVYDPSDRGIGPHGKQVLNPANIYYTPSSGIWQTVWLERVPATHIEDLKLTPDIDKGILDVNVSVTGKETGYLVRISAISGNRSISSLKGKIGEPMSLKIPNVHLWSPNDPFLYDLSVELLRNNKVVDKVQSYFGMRKVSIQKDEKGLERIFLNNKYLYNLGVLDQGFWPEGLYTAPTDEAMEFDIKAIKGMGFNTIRKHIKVEPARWYYYADKLGIMVWQDMVNPSQSLSSGAKEEFEREAKETLDQLHNYPSITTWVLFNERWGAYDQARLTQWMKEYDPSRIVNGHSGELLYVNDKLRAPSKGPYINSDVTDVHSYPDPRNPLKLTGKAMVLGEFGGVGVPVPGHQWDDLQGWGYIQATPDQLEKRYREMTDQLKVLEFQGLSGSIYTQPFDVEGEENGLVTYDREVIKIPIRKLREINSTVINDSSIIGNNVVLKNIDVHNTDEKYGEFLKEFDNGNRDSAFLRRLILISLRKQDTTRTRELSKTYINSRRDLIALNNIKFIYAITQKSTDPGFEIFIKNKNAIDKFLGAGSTNRKIKSIIQREEIDPLIKAGKPINWDRIQEEVSQRYGHVGLEHVLFKRLLYYWSVSKDWNLFGEYYVKYFELALDHSELHINNISWDIFIHVNNEEVLSFAAGVMKYDIEKYDSEDPKAYDTYANILYKLGRTTEAIKYENKAVDLAENRDQKEIFLKTRAKMQSGIPTWK